MKFRNERPAKSNLQYNFILNYICENIPFILPSFYKIKFAEFIPILNLHTKISKKRHI